ncbi:MAG TPA: cobalamin biosynthesis protein [Acetobacteraceae bacterium]|jgi:cobalt-precorrin 5A hydrolase
MGGAQAMIVAGIGCRRGCAAEDIVAAVRRAEAESGLVVTDLAVPRFKSGEAGLDEARRMLGLDLMLVDDAALAAMQARCVTMSEVAARETGFASVAEAAALAAAGGVARLCLSRIAVGGATCALAAA